MRKIASGSHRAMRRGPVGCRQLSLRRHPRSRRLWRGRPRGQCSHGHAPSYCQALFEEVYGHVAIVQPDLLAGAYAVALLVVLVLQLLLDISDVCRHRGTLIYTGATASLRGGANFLNLAMPKFALRAVAQSAAREFQPKGIHVAHVIIDGQKVASEDGISVREMRSQVQMVFQNPDSALNRRHSVRRIIGRAVRRGCAGVALQPRNARAERVAAPAPVSAWARSAASGKPPVANTAIAEANSSLVSATVPSTTSSSPPRPRPPRQDRKHRRASRDRR